MEYIYRNLGKHLWICIMLLVIGGTRNGYGQAGSGQYNTLNAGTYSSCLGGAYNDYRDILNYQDGVWYSFSIYGGSTQVDISLCGSNFDTQLYLMDENGNTIEGNDDNGPLCSGTRSSIRRTLLEGNYLIRADRYGIGTGDVVLQLDIWPGLSGSSNGSGMAKAIATGSLSSSGYYQHTLNSAHCFGNTYGGSAPDIWCQFILDEQGTVNIGLSAQISTNLYLLNSAGTLLVQENSTIEQVLAPDTYYVVFEGQGSSSGSMEITMQYQGIISSACPVNNVIFSPETNYIVTYTALAAGIQSTYNLNQRGSCELRTNVTYYDGLGRPSQIVHVGSSSLGWDIVQPQEYDNYGREVKRYQPYSIYNSYRGSYRTSMFTEQASFYSSGSSGLTATNYAYSPIAYEPSPLNKVTEQGAPGDAWQLAGTPGTSNPGHTIKFAESGNAAAEVRLWQITGTGCAANNDYYAANQLSKHIVTDENNHQTIEFRNKQGNVVLKRTESTSNIYLNTYYVYDQQQNLRYVIPPAVSQATITDDETIFERYVYAYRYDQRNRVVEKKIPGKGWEYLIYNKLDQVTLTQDAMQRQNNQWYFIKYDAYGRIALTGIDVIISTRAGLQQDVDDNTVNVCFLRQDTSELHGYSNDAYPWYSGSETILSINYYDVYDFQQDVFGIMPASAGINARGLQTAKVERVLGTNQMLWTVYFYDDKDRLTQSRSQNHLGGTDIVSNTWSFSGELLTSKRTHVANGQTTLIANRYQYDYMGRRTIMYQKTGNENSPEVLLSELNYNETGQIIRKKMHNSEQVSTYAYNERSWLSNSESDQFSFRLKYADGTFPQFNGNIANQDWGSGSNYPNSYVYNYDRLNRLLSGIGTGMSEVLTYDVMGNIASMNRDNTGAGTYGYKGNRLDQILNGPLATGLYGYDLNGNAVTDGRNGMILTYNILNLPATVSGSGTSIIYTYNANGNKLKKVSNGVSRHYIDGIEYEGNQIDIIHTEEGVARNNNGFYTYEYNLTDHLGNVRATFYKNENMDELEILQRDDYYAFGLRKNTFASSNNNKYLYNSKELQEELGQYDYGARFYDPVIGRFNVIDRFSEKYTDFSQYQYAANNPISNIDVNGDSTWTTTRTVRNGNNITNYHTTHITGKVLKASTGYGSASEYAKGLNNRLNSQKGTQSMENGMGGTTTDVYSINAKYEGANSINDVGLSDHLVVLVDNVLGTADPSLGGGQSAGLASIPGKIAYVEPGSVETGFHEVGHNLGLSHPGKNSASDPMSYTGKGANFSPVQMEIIYNNSKVGSPNRGYNRARIMNVTEGYNNISTNERPYQGKRTQGMLIPLPLKKN